LIVFENNNTAVQFKLVYAKYTSFRNKNFGCSENDYSKCI